VAGSADRRLVVGAVERALMRRSVQRHDLGIADIADIGL
jgi:hypothetical protein